MKRMAFIILLIVAFHVTCCLSHDLSHFSIDEITSMFGTEECIEGSIVEFQPPSAVPPTVLAYENLDAYENLEVMLKKIGGRMAQQWAPTLSGTYNSLMSGNMTTGRMEETKATKSAAKTRKQSAGTENSATEFSGKTPMSVVNELSLLTKVKPKYSLLDVQGPTHKRIFTVRLKFGGEEYSAFGPSVKKAQQAAASKFLQYTHYQQPLQEMARKQQMRKENVGIKTATTLVYEIAAKQKLSVTFDVESQTGPPHLPIFVTKCALGDKITRGQGSSKKLSKRAAAEEMLELLQYHESYSVLPNTMARKSRKKRSSSQKKKRPLSLLNTYEKMTSGVWTDQTIAAIMDSEFWSVSDTNSKGLHEQLAALSNHLAKSGSSLFGEATAKSTLKDTQSSSFKSEKNQEQIATAKNTLMQAGDLLDFKIQFSDLTKQRNGDFISVVSLSTNHPMLCLGVGKTVEASHDQAALRALKALWKLDTEQISSSYTAKKKSDWGDWLHWTGGMVPSARDVFHIK